MGRRIRVGVVGANGVIGCGIYRFLKLNLPEEYFVSAINRQKTDGDECLDICHDNLSILNQFDFLIVCARSNSFSCNIRFARNLKDQVPAKARVLFLSSNAVEQKIYINRFFQSYGEGYIREKRKIEQIFSDVDHIQCIRPSLVLGEGSVWTNFFESFPEGHVFFIPNNIKKKLVMTTEVGDIAQSAFQFVTSGGRVVFCNSDLVEIEKLFPCKVRYDKSNYFYSKNKLLDLMFKGLFTRLVPDFLVFFLQSRLNSRGASDEVVKSPPRELSGMYRVYLSAKEVVDNS